MLEAINLPFGEQNLRQMRWHCYGASVIAMRGFKSMWRFVRMP